MATDDQGLIPDGWLTTGAQQWMPFFANIRPYTNNHIAAHSDTYGTYSFSGFATAQTCGSVLTYTLDSTNHWVTATASFTWTFAAAQAGLTFYGIVTYDSSGSPNLTYAETFQTSGVQNPYVVPVGGGAMVYNFSCKFKNC